MAEYRIIEKQRWDGTKFYPQEKSGFDSGEWVGGWSYILKPHPVQKYLKPHPAQEYESFETYDKAYAFLQGYEEAKRVWKERQAKAKDIIHEVHL